MDLQKLITEQLKDEVLDKISKVSGADSSTASSIAQQMIPVFLDHLQKNSTTPSEAKILGRAIDQDHNGSILDDIAGNIGTDSSILDGSKILGHVFGDKLDKVRGEISKNTGAKTDVTNTVMSVLAPVMLGNIGKIKTQQGLDIATVLDHLKSGKKLDITSVITDLVDQNDDGSVLDDIARFGSKFFNKK